LISVAFLVTSLITEPFSALLIILQFGNVVAGAPIKPQGISMANDGV